ncbi:MAG: lecithin retinol acyltransferase family protein [Candidatus Hydrogenedentota bacterium]
MALGDHIRVKRWRGFYYHHGIDMGDGTVVHLSGEPLRVHLACVCQVPMEEFQDGGVIEVVPHEEADREPAAVVAEALAHVGECGYDLWKNNCEHFATYCVTGRKESVQITLLQKAAKVTLTTAAGTAMVAWGVYAVVRRRKRRSGSSLKG